jgi:hypothetical protein
VRTLAVANVQVADGDVYNFVRHDVKPEAVRGLIVKLLAQMNDELTPCSESKEIDKTLTRLREQFLSRPRRRRPRARRQSSRSPRASTPSTRASRRASNRRSLRASR